jgi:hypothetical protein
MSCSAADAAASLGFDLEYRIFRHLISSPDSLSAVTISANVMLNHLEVLKLSDGYELWSQKISVPFEAIGLYDIILTGIDLSPLASA